MKNKTVLTLSVVLGLLILASVVPSGVKRFTADKPKAELVLFSQNPDFGNINKITITETNRSVVLEKSAGGWKIGELAADVDRINALFSAVKELQLKEVVAKSSVSHSRLGVDDANAAIIKFEKPDSLPEEAVTLYLGNFVRKIEDFFIRRGGQETVYFASGSLKEIADPETNNWRSRAMTLIADNEIHKISYVKDRVLVSLARFQADDWKGVFGKQSLTVTAEKMKSLLSSFNPLNASGFLGESEIETFKKLKNPVVYSIYGPENKALATLKFYKQEEDWWILRPDRPNVYYKMPLSDAGRIMPDKKAFE